ncbi:MAG: 3'-5' exonuclease [Flavobacterium sp.]|nr:3'-5' exonuclease [Flavobacterium sp.]
MFDWLKNINKDYPEFWKDYLSKFDAKPQRVVVFTTHVSGHNPVKDVIFSFGAIAIVNDKIILGDTFETVIVQYKYLHDNGLPNDFLAKSTLEKRTESQALEALVNYIGNSTLVGYKTHLDVDMINVALEKIFCGRLRNEALDVELMHRKMNDWNEKTGSLEELFKSYKVAVPDTSSSLENAYNLALIYLKLKSKLGIKT